MEKSEIRSLFCLDLTSRDLLFPDRVPIEQCGTLDEQNEAKMKLYKVQVEIQLDMMVIAEDPEEAKNVATENAGEDIRNNWTIGELVHGGVVSEISSPDQMPTGWRHSLPWLSAGVPGTTDKTCEDWAKELGEQKREKDHEAERAKNQMTIFAPAKP